MAGLLSTVQGGGASAAAPGSKASEALHLHKSAGKVLPKIVILDLDYTLWDCFCAHHTSPPYRRTGPNEVRDANGAGKLIKIGTDTRDILTALRAHGCRLAIASLNGDFPKSSQLLEAFGIWHFFQKEVALVQILRGTVHPPFPPYSALLSPR